MVKKILNLLFVIALFLSIIATGFSIGTNYNSQGSFIVSIKNQDETVFNDNIDSTYTIYIKNRLNKDQNIYINVPKISGFDVKVNPGTNISLKPYEEKKVTLEFTANSNFDYSPNIISPDTIVISQKENYEGNFEFPVTIQSEIDNNESVMIKFGLNIVKKEKEPLNFKVRIASNFVSPKEPLKFSILSENLYNKSIKANVYVLLNNEKVLDENIIFSPKNNYDIEQINIPLKYNPGKYDAKVVVRVKTNTSMINEWFDEKEITIKPYHNLIVSYSEDKNIFVDKFKYNFNNLGNVKENYILNINKSFFKDLFLNINKNNISKIEKTNNNTKIYLTINKGQKISINYEYNYIPLYIILFVIFVIIIYIAYRNNSNPLDVETKIYDIVKVIHEGVKSLKIRIGFENIKEEKIDQIKIIFRMPAYLAIKENSFLLAEPNHVLKGKNQYKLVWIFKNFEKGDSRILGFTLVNSKGILGDIRIPDLEIEIKINGKIRKYYKSFPIVRG
jgi:hypothetical protein